VLVGLDSVCLSFSKEKKKKKRRYLPCLTCSANAQNQNWILNQRDQEFAVLLGLRILLMEEAPVQIGKEKQGGITARSTFFFSFHKKKLQNCIC
jgi:hypothetical protein